MNKMLLEKDKLSDDSVSSSIHNIEVHLKHAQTHEHQVCSIIFGFFLSTDIPFIPFIYK